MNRMEQFSTEETNSSLSSSIPVGAIAMDQFSTEQINYFLSTSDNWTDDDWNLLSTAVPDGLSPYVSEETYANLMEDVVVHAVEPGAVQSSSSQSISASHTQPSQQWNSICGNERSTALQCRRRIHVSEWEEKPDLIRTLYIDQEKSLKVMRQILQEDGFHASEKAYKDKIREWGLTKNLKQRQAVFMLKMAKKRKEEEDKDTIFFYRGIQVSDTKIRRYSKAIETSSDLGSVPSNITYVTPGHSGSRPRGIRTSQQSDYQQGRSPTMTALELIQPTTHEVPYVDPTIPSSLLRMGHFGFHFLDLKQSLAATSEELRPAWKDLSEDQQDAAMDRISYIFQEFTYAGSNTEGAYLSGVALKCLALPSTLRELRPHIGWDYPHRVFLPLLHFQAQCTIASGAYGQAEVIIDRLLVEYKRIYGVDGQRLTQRLNSTILLLGKTYLTQEKFYLLSRLLRTWSSDLDRIQGIQKEMLAIHKFLFLSRTLEVKNYHDHNACPSSCLGDHKYFTIANDLVLRILDIQEANDDQVVEILWAAGLPEALRYHYVHCHSGEGKLVSLLGQMQFVVRRAIMSGAIKKEGQASYLIYHAIDGLTQSYALLGKHYEWCGARPVSMKRKGCDMIFLRQTEQTEIEYIMHLMHPLFSEFLEQWPSIALPSIPKSDGPFGYLLSNL